VDAARQPPHSREDGGARPRQTPARLAVVVDPGDARMGQAGRVPGLGAEPGQERLVARPAGRQKLHGDGPGEEHIWPRSEATDGETGWLSWTGLVASTVLRSLAVTCLTRYGVISLPPLAMVAANMASCSGVTVSLYCPMAENAVSA